MWSLSMDNPNTYFQPARDLPARTPLADCMRMPAQAGQPTWPEPLLNETCGNCFFFDVEVVSESSQKKGRGRCRRQAQITGGKWATQVERKYVACSEFAVAVAEESDG